MFVTEEGRFQYKVIPQGFVASGDGYNQRFDRIIEDVERHTKCVDDVVEWDIYEDIAQHWWRVIDFLELCGRNGITLNLSKLQFCQVEIEFAGFVVTEDHVKPLPRYLDAIRNFPRPSNITDIRSWFGLVTQVSHYAKLTELMEPFKKFLSPKVRFEWSEDLDQRFEKSKLEIITAIEEGVQIFDPNRATVLMADWSKKGIGYFLFQKHCTCLSKTTGCCEQGWKITLAGSRFLQPAESNYWPVEGEALAVKWGLEDTRFFTYGCNKLVVQTDHKPLLKIFGPGKMAEIPNQRVLSFVEKSMSWRFDLVHVPGTTIPAPDATSRHPNPTGCKGQVNVITEDEDEKIDMFSPLRVHAEPDQIEVGVVAAARLGLRELQAVTWQRVREETAKDPYMLQLEEMSAHGFPESVRDMPIQLAQYWRYRHEIYSIDGVLLYRSRIIIPPSLRLEVCDHLHAAHQGTSQMSGRAGETVFWPGITSEVFQSRQNCEPCQIGAPSQTHLPPAEPFVAICPFQAIVSDYFHLRGQDYVLMVDRFSNWPHLAQVKRDQGMSGSEGLVRVLRELFAMFGVPEQLSSDGGPEYIAKLTRDFLHMWGVTHRQSSAYHPQSNGRAEVSVKAMKRLLQDNVSESGSLDTDAIMRGMLQLRNTPERDSGLSPAQVLLGRRLRDALPFPPMTNVFERSSLVADPWKDMWAHKELALKARLGTQVDRLDARGRDLPPLQIGDRCRIQNQYGNHPGKWDRTGQVVQAKGHDQYVVRVDGSGRVTIRNRKFLRKISVYQGMTREKFIQRGQYPVVTSPQLNSGPVETTQQQDTPTPMRTQPTPDARTADKETGRDNFSGVNNQPDGDMIVPPSTADREQGARGGESRESIPRENQGELEGENIVREPTAEPLRHVEARPGRPRRDRKPNRRYPASEWDLETKQSE